MTHALVLAGLGPYFKSRDDLVGSFFDAAAAPGLGRRYPLGAEGPFALERLTFTGPDGRRHRLLRPERSGSLSLDVGSDEVDRAPTPNLVAITLASILDRAGVSHDVVPLDIVWDDEPGPDPARLDVVLVSTTFICERRSLARVVRWCTDRYPGVPLVVGGQYSNLKHTAVLRAHPEVRAVVRGDAEDALPALLRALGRGDDLATVPNLVYRDGDGGVVTTPFGYADLDAHPSPVLTGRNLVVPYESMRGCPFRCGFCSFPAASPRWRCKSADKIVADWARYRDDNGTRHVRALDSTFTVPAPRFHELLDRLPAVGVGWEAFARANAITGPDVVEALAAAGCRTLSIGFESMSDATLDHMNKKVLARANRRAFELLRPSAVGYRISFMVGYPGERPEDYEATHRFLVDEYAGHFQLYVFSLQDETMPLWEDAERFELRVHDEADPDYAWSHSGMDVDTARQLRKRTLRDVRWANDRAVALLWQPEFQTPLLPHRPPAENYRVEKLVERAGLVPLDIPDVDRGRATLAAVLDELRALGVTPDMEVPVTTTTTAAALATP